MATYVVIAFACLLIACAGCGKRDLSISGAVTFDGQPVDEGSIVFEPADGKGPTVGGTIESGRYSVTSAAEVLPGAKVVRITAVRTTGRRFEAGPPAPPGTMVDEVETYLPAIYNEESRLTCEVTSGANEHDFRLQVSLE